MKKKNATRKHKKRHSFPICIPVLTLNGRTKINFTVSGYTEDLEQLCYLFNNPIQKELIRVAKLFYLNLIKPIEAKLPTTNATKPRGKHAINKDPDTGEPESALIYKMKLFAAAAFAYYSYWVKRAKDEWPDEVRTSIEEQEKLGAKIYDGRSKNKFRASVITYYEWKKKFGRSIIEMGLAGPSNNENFKKRYTQKNEFVKAAMAAVDSKPFATVENLIQAIN